MKKKYVDKNILLIVILLCFAQVFQAQVALEKEIKISDIGLHFNGSKVATNSAHTADTAPYDFVFGSSISAKGDCIKTYGKYVFMTWYKGGKDQRYVMLTRYNTETGTSVDIQFPHRHTGFQNQYWLGESHNAIAVAVSPKDGTIHMLYDMHAYSRTKPSNGSLSDDYFRYSYSVKNAASLSDADFTLDKFVKNSNGGYKHLSLNGGEDYKNFSALTYPQFFTNVAGDVFMYMREGGNNNGAYKFSKYNATTSTWSSFTNFNVLNAKSKGVPNNWGLYGNMKYINGKVRIGFQRRENKTDKFEYQNGLYYAYSDNQDGTNSWKTHDGKGFSLPLIDADKIKVFEPGDLVETTDINQVYIVGGFDWTVTDNGDVHMISRVQDRENNITKHVHTYKRAGTSDFVTSTEFSGAETIYTYGKDIYIIGLNSNNKVYVEKAKGGTNNFRKVYEATSGKSFDHGRVHIANGKLYFYMMEKLSGSAQPLYLQIIDLDVDAAPQPLSVNFRELTDNMMLNVDQNLDINVDAYTDNGFVNKMEFLIDGQLYQTDSSAPFKSLWRPATVGNHTIQAIAYSSSGEKESTLINVTVNAKDYSDLTGTAYRLKNVATGKYMYSQDSRVFTSSDISGVSTHWKFVKAGGYFNIESEVKGILRAAGTTSEIISTSFSAPREDSDKQWIVIYNDTEKNYSFKARTGSRYLYNQYDDKVVYSSQQDDRSKWIVESISTLSTNDFLSNQISINVFPNPTRNQFTVQINEISNAKIEIFDVLGKLVYKQIISSEKTEINTNNNFKPGLYLIKIDTFSQTYYNKVLIK
ncbi:BNR-4 repeat-containing protein [Polaribacter sp. OB-PA-B3]